MADSTGLYQYAGQPEDRLCVDCVHEVIEANPLMMKMDWQPAVISNFDAECCDSCDCVPAAEGKTLVLEVDK